jgi:hypothetical protein
MDETVLKEIASSVKEVHKHAASDGSIFNTASEALTHQFSILFNDWYSSKNEATCAYDNILSHKNGVISADSLLWWLEHKREAVETFFKFLDSLPKKEENKK